MKANEAPAKIYLDPVKMAETESVVLSIVPDFRVEDNDVEYTRTDAFIEKAKKWFEKQNEWFDPNGNRHCDLNDFEDFRKYMEESKVWK